MLSRENINDMVGLFILVKGFKHMVFIIEDLWLPRLRLGYMDVVDLDHLNELTPTFYYSGN
jgi:hypothetical protein